MQVTDIINLVTNVGFPVTLSFILIKYVLQTMGEKLDRMEDTLQTLSQQIKELEDRTDALRTADLVKKKAR